MNLFTKNGEPLQVSGDTVYSKSGKVVGKIYGDKVHGTDGRYVGTIVNERLIYRSSQSASIRSSFSASNRGGIGKGNRGAVGIWGDEPNIPD